MRVVFSIVLKDYSLSKNNIKKIVTREQIKTVRLKSFRVTTSWRNKKKSSDAYKRFSLRSNNRPLLSKPFFDDTSTKNLAFSFLAHFYRVK